jgi:hypothetical protein
VQDLLQFEAQFVEQNLSFATVLQSQCIAANVNNKCQFDRLRTRRVRVIQVLSSYRAVNTLHCGERTKLLVTYKTKLAVWSESHTKHTNVT